MSERRKLTKRVVDTIKFDASKPGKSQYHWDAELRGFGLRITENGVLAYVARYRTADGRDRTYTLGRHGRDLTHSAGKVTGLILEQGPQRIPATRVR